MKKGYQNPEMEVTEFCGNVITESPINTPPDHLPDVNP